MQDFDITWEQFIAALKSHKVKVINEWKVYHSGEVVLKVVKLQRVDAMRIKAIPIVRYNPKEQVSKYIIRSYCN